MAIKEYKCPNCGGAKKFDTSSQNMKCPFCDTEFEIEALEEHQKELAVPGKDKFEWNKENISGTWDENELNEFTQGACPSCGAELLGDKNTAAMVCPNCGNSQIVLKRLTGMLKPDYIIPFKLEKKSAIEALKKFYKGKRLLPDCFKDGNRINCIQGTYLPFWLFDANAHGHICYRATRTKSWSDSNFNYVKTDHFSIVRDGTMAFEKVPVDGSEKMDDNYMDAIEPFNYSDIKNFQTAFLSGFIAEKYDVDAEKSQERAGRRIKASIETEFEKSVSGYASVFKESSAVDIESGKVSYSLFPAWILNTKYKKENYMFLMNGQTGKLVGKLPVDFKKAWKYRFLFTSIFGAVFTAIVLFLRLFTDGISRLIEEWHLSVMAGSWVGAFILGLIIVQFWKSGMNNVKMQTHACGYVVPDSLNFKIKKDRFLYSTVSKTRRQQSSSGSRIG
jgi:DNA-directed RNA polymerase subunit RPC12/RpoP